MYSSTSGVPPMPLTNASTSSPDSYGRSSTIAVASRSTIWLAGASGSR
jgi:hypothetical protein